MLNQINIGRRDLTVSDTHWQEETDFDFSSNEKIVLILPGGMVDRPHHANGCIKRFLLATDGLLPNDLKVLCAYYNDVGLPTHRIRSLKKERLLTDIKSSIPVQDLPEEGDFSSLFQKFFMPILVDKAGQKKSSKDVINTLNRLLIVTFCYGGFVAFDMTKRFEKKLKELQFTLDEQNKILKAFTTLATSSRFFMQRTKTSVFHVVSYSDKQKELNWHHKNFHAFINTKKRGQDEGGLIFLSDTEMVLAAERVLSVEMDDHHFRGYFGDLSNEFKKSSEGENVTRFITDFIRLYFQFNGKKSFKEMLPFFSNKTYVKENLYSGKILLLDYKKYVLQTKKNFVRQERFVLNGDIKSLMDMVKAGNEILSFKNSDGDFLIHLAVQKGDVKMVDFLTNQNPFWFQAFNKKKENPVLLALRNRNLPIAKLLWERLSTLTLPPFESHRILRNIRRDTFKNVLFFIRKTPLAAQLMDFMLEARWYLPIHRDDFSIIARQFNKIKNRRSKEALLTLCVLEKCFKRGMEETGLMFKEAIPVHHRKLIPLRIARELEKE
jgi:hypothetical protein